MGGIEKLADLINRLTEDGAKRLGEFLNQLGSSGSEKFGAWLAKASPQEISEVTHLLNHASHGSELSSWWQGSQQRSGDLTGEQRTLLARISHWLHGSR